MKIVHVIDSLGRGGAENLIIGLAGELLSRDHDVCIITLQDQIDYEDLLAQYQVPIFSCGFTGTIYSISSLIETIKKLRALFKRFRPDVINTHIFLSDILVRLTARRGTAVVTTFHTNETWWCAPRSLPKTIKFGLEKITANYFGKEFIAVSTVAKNQAQLQLGIDSARCHVIKNGIDTNRFYPRSSSGILPPRIIHVARFYPEKCHEISIKAFELVLEREPGAELWLVGDGPHLNKVKQFARDLNVDHRIKFFGLRKDIQELLTQCRIFWLTSQREGLPISLLEAMATGLPPVVTAVGDIINVIADGQNGYLVPVGDFQIIAERTIELFKNKSAYDRISITAAETINAEYSIKNTATHYLEIYNKAIEKA